MIIRFKINIFISSFYRSLSSASIFNVHLHNTLLLIILYISISLAFANAIGTNTMPMEDPEGDADEGKPVGK